MTGCRTIFFFAFNQEPERICIQNVIIGKQNFCEVLSILKRFKYFDWLSYHIFLRIESGTKALNGQSGYAFTKRDGPEQNLVVPGHRAHAVSNTDSKQLPAFPLEPVRESNPGLRGGRRECYPCATVAPHDGLPTQTSGTNNERVISTFTQVPARLNHYLPGPTKNGLLRTLVGFHPKTLGPIVREILALFMTDKEMPVVAILFFKMRPKIFPVKIL